MYSIFFVIANFIALLILIPVGAKLAEFSKGITATLMLILGASTPYLLRMLLKYFHESFDYKWYHCVILLMIIGAMNNANMKGTATKNAQFASTFLFSSFAIIAILMLWI